MNIELKPNNVPTKPGFYFSKYLFDSRPRLEQIAYRGKELYCVADPCKVSNINASVLWSDEITFTVG